jgi:hypothetical protein
MHPVLIAEFARATSAELQRRAASARTARAAADARRARRKVRAEARSR